MREFDHYEALQVDEAVNLLVTHKGKAKVHAGGTDLLSVLKDDILPTYPGAIVNIKAIPDLDYVREGGKNGHPRRLLPAFPTSRAPLSSTGGMRSSRRRPAPLEAHRSATSRPSAATCARTSAAGTFATPRASEGA